MVVESLRRLLVVDDDPSIVEVVKYSLRDGCEVVGVNSGEAALEAVRDKIYPVVVLDMRMKGLSGTETLKALRQLSRYQQVIVFTGHLTGDSAMRAVNLGAFRYLTKPFRLAEFRETVELAFTQFERELKADAWELSHPGQLEVLGLGEREAEVVFRLLQDEGTAEIAKAMRISPRTVEKHIERVFHHFGISMRTRLAGRVRELRFQYLLNEAVRNGGFLGGVCLTVSLLASNGMTFFWEGAVMLLG